LSVGYHYAELYVPTPVHIVLIVVYIGIPGLFLLIIDYLMTASLDLSSFVYLRYHLYCVVNACMVSDSGSLSPWRGVSSGCRWRNDLQYGA
jgi:hypothetical protein